MFPFVYKGRISWLGSTLLVIGFFCGWVKFTRADGTDVTKEDVLNNDIRW